MTKDYQEYNTPMSKAVFKAFEDRINEVLAQIAPDWGLHHMRITHAEGLEQEECRIGLVIRPLIKGRFVDGRILPHGLKYLERK